VGQWFDTAGTDRAARGLAGGCRSPCEVFGAVSVMRERDSNSGSRQLA
jgi:hypothetical protein